MVHSMTIGSVNLNSSKSDINKQSLKDFVINKSIDLLFVQELVYENFSFLPGYNAIVNVGECNRGTGILIRNSFPYEGVLCDISGRITSVIIN